MFNDKLKSLIKLKDNEDTGNNKKKIENLVFLIIILIVTVVAINYIWNGNKKSDNTNETSKGKQLASAKTTSNSNQNSSSNKKTTENTLQNRSTTDSNQDNLESRLESILSNINGVGDVKVLINYSESSETVAMYNENSKTSSTEESDKSGGTRKIEETDSQKEVVYQEENGTKTPIVQKMVEPKIEGAIITSKGASDINIKTNIIQAVEAVTGLPTHKICVLEGN